MPEPANRSSLRAGKRGAEADELDMTIQFRCTGCAEAFSVPDNMAGTQANCNKCGALLTIPAPGAAPAPARGELEKADAFLLCAVVIRVEGIARVLRRRHPGIADRPAQPHVRDRQRAPRAMIGIGAPLLIL